MAELFENYNVTPTDNVSIFTNNWHSQGFTAIASHTITSVKILAYRIGNAGTLTLSIRATSSDVPTGSDLVTGTLDVSGITTDTAGEWIEVTFSTPLQLTKGTVYQIVCSGNGADTSNRLVWNIEYPTGSYAGGKAGTSSNGSTWVSRAWDNMFQIYGVIDSSYVKLLLHGDGADASTTITDETGKTVTPNGNAQIDTAQKVFGTGSILFDGTTDYLTVPDSDDWAFGDGDFTIDFRFRPTATPSNYDTWLQQYQLNVDKAILWKFDYGNAGKIRFVAINNISSPTEVANYETASAQTFSADTWYHLALVRSGSNIYIFKDGVLLSLTTITAIGTTVLSNIASVLNIGYDAQNAGRDVNGRIDELRILKGVARWTENFTPPTSAYQYKVAPTVTTQAVSVIDKTTATGNGNVTSDGGDTITERGTVYSTSENPTTSDTKDTAAGTTGAFTTSIDTLTKGTLYHVRAYAINSVGTSYGSDVTFTTKTDYTPTKGLIYKVRGTPAAKTKSLKYTTKSAPSAKTKVLKYTTKSTPSAKTKSLKYTTKSTPSAKTKGLIYDIKKSISPIEKDLIYNIKYTPSAKTKSLTYTVKAPPSAIEKGMTYTVTISQTPKTKDLTYKIKTNATPKTKSLTYDVTITPSAIEKDLTYKVKPSIDKTKSLQYTVISTPAAITKSMEYIVVQLVNMQKSLAYMIKAPVIKTKSLKYTIPTTPAPITKGLSYYILQTKSKTNSLKYSVKTSIPITKSMKYDIETVGKIMKGLQYAVRSAKQVTKGLKYVIVTTTSISKGLAYKTKAGISKTKILKYNIERSKIKTKTLKYVVVQKVIKTKSLQYVIRVYPYCKKTSPYTVKNSPYKSLVHSC